jgi:DNA-directed RNA polymerase specialized sigma24 family protein
MRDTKRSGGRPDLPQGCLGEWRPRGGHSGGATRRGARLEARQAEVLAAVYEAHYGSLLRLAALLTGDAAVAEMVAADAVVALLRRPGMTETGDRALAYLRRQIVARSRRAGRYHRRLRRTAGAADAPASLDGQEAVAGTETESRFARSPVVRALRSLRPGARAAVVLTLYLDLTEDQAAAVAGMSRAALRRHLAAANRALGADLLAGGLAAGWVTLLGR